MPNIKPAAAVPQTLSKEENICLDPTEEEAYQKYIACNPKSNMKEFLEKRTAYLRKVNMRSNPTEMIIGSDGIIIAVPTPEERDELNENLKLT